MPECGFDVGASVQAYALRTCQSPPPNAAWAGRVRQGAWLSVAAFALAVGAVLSPEAWTYLPSRNAPLERTPGRVVFLGVAATWWVLAWASAWRLATRERPRLPGAGPGVWAVAARALTTANLLVPFCWAWATWNDEYVYGAPGLVLMCLHFCGLAGGAALLVRVGQLVRRVGRRVAFVESLLLALAVPASVFYALSVGNRGPSSLAMMCDLPVYPFGIPWVFEAVIDVLSPPTSWSEPAVWVYLILPLWSLSLLVRLIIAYRPSALRPEAARGRRSAASWSP